MALHVSCGSNRVSPSGGTLVAMRLVYTLHARRRLFDRDITEDEIEDCILHADRRGRTKDGNMIYMKAIGGRVVHVVVAVGSHPPRVITLWG